MKTLREYVEEKELLNEDIATVVVSAFAFPSLGLALAWAGSLILTSYILMTRRVTNNIIKMWRVALGKNTLSKRQVESNIKEIAEDPEVKKQVDEMEENKRKFGKELDEVYSAIDEKDFSKARTSFLALNRDLQNNPDVHKIIISELTTALKEPPLYVTSPGNKTYQAIKKIINIRVARAAAAATKMAIEKNSLASNIKKIEKEINDE